VLVAVEEAATGAEAVALAWALALELVEGKRVYRLSGDCQYQLVL
jgi:hypothetical protein